MVNIFLTKEVFFLILFFAFVTFSIAQDRCAHVEYMNYLYQKNPSLKKDHDNLNKAINNRIKGFKKAKTSATSTAEITYEIPVVVHVIYNNYAQGITNISDEQIYSQIDVLNKDYSKTNADTNLTYDIYKNVAANVNIHFCLASMDPDGGPTNGIVRVFSPTTTFQYPDNSLHKLSYWPSDQYLNIWVCNIVSPILGYAQFPSNSGLPGLAPSDGPDYTDGVVIDFKAFGAVGQATYPYNKGRTATHEVGHWLGLIHTWGNATCGDDYVADTPQQEEANADVACDTSYSYCSGPATIDMRQNYMDYSPDACLTLFTEGQKERIRTVLEISPPRVALQHSPGCCVPTNILKMPQVVNFEDNYYLTEGWSILNYDAASAYTKQWTSTSPGAYGTSSYGLMIENDSVYTEDDSTYWDVLESPPMDLSSGKRPMLDFDLAYARNTSSSTTDSLVLYYNVGCKDRWQVAQVFYGDALVTTSKTMDNFVPAVDDWKRITANLGFLQGKKYVRFRIAAFSKGVNNLYVDNINFFKEADDFEAVVYPMPAGDEFNIEVIYAGYRDVTIEAFNSLGKKMFQREKNATTSFLETVNSTDFAAGVYIIRVTSGENKVTKKVIVR